MQKLTSERAQAHCRKRGKHRKQPGSLQSKDCAVIAPSVNPKQGYASSANVKTPRRNTLLNSQMTNKKSYQGRTYAAIHSETVSDRYLTHSVAVIF